MIKDINLNELRLLEVEIKEKQNLLSISYYRYIYKKLEELKNIELTLANLRQLISIALLERWAMLINYKRCGIGNPDLFDCYINKEFSFKFCYVDEDEFHISIKHKNISKKYYVDLTEYNLPFALYTNFVNAESLKNIKTLIEGKTDFKIQEVE